MPLRHGIDKMGFKMGFCYLGGNFRSSPLCLQEAKVARPVENDQPLDRLIKPPKYTGREGNDDAMLEPLNHKVHHRNNHKLRFLFTNCNSHRLRYEAQPVNDLLEVIVI